MSSALYVSLLAPSPEITVIDNPWIVTRNIRASPYHCFTHPGWHRTLAWTVSFPERIKGAKAAMPPTYDGARCFARTDSRHTREQVHLGRLQHRVTFAHVVCIGRNCPHVWPYQKEYFPKLLDIIAITTSRSTSLGIVGTRLVLKGTTKGVVSCFHISLRIHAGVS